MTQLTYNLRLADTHALLVDGQADAAVPPTGRERSLMQARMVSRVLPVLLDLLRRETSLEAARAAGLTVTPRPGVSMNSVMPAVREFLTLLRRHQGWLTQPWQLNAPDDPAGRFPAWTVHGAEWGEVLQDLPSAMMAAAKANARVDDFLSIHELDTSVLLAEEEAPLLVH